MVYFTCNHCGDSVKKPAVEKHYNQKCRGAPVSVSCMDCLADFHGEEFVAHTKCISEMQKYSGKDYKPRESENKGAKKQESWIDTVRSILDSPEYDLKPATRQALIKLKSYDNVPRKKAKFINFVTNSVHIPKATVEDVWGILERELERMKLANQKAANPTTHAADSQPEVPSSTNGQAEGDNVANDVENKKKKKKNSVNTPQEEYAMKRRSDGKSFDDELPKKRIKCNELQFQEQEGRRDVQENGGKKKKRNKALAAEQVGTVSSTQPDGAEADSTADFEWASVLGRIVAKNSGGISIEKLKKKLLKKYLSKLAIQDLSEKQQKSFNKKFKKYLKRSHFQINGDLVRVY